MSAFGMNPKFGTIEEYASWRRGWRCLYKEVSSNIRRQKKLVKSIQREQEDGDLSREMAKLRGMQVMASKAMTLLETAVERRKRIEGMFLQLEEQAKQFPLQLDKCSAIDFHFNKGSITFPFLPAWIVKAKGSTYYVNHVDFDTVGTTRETPDHPSTKGSMRFRNSSLNIDAEGNAVISRR